MFTVDVKKTFGAQLARIRKTKGWSQEYLALESGLARSYLGGVERGQRNVSLVNICRLSSALGVKLAVLMDFSITDEVDSPPLVS
jgi:transcriptional regulator with XRE-family HTH domain